MAIQPRQERLTDYDSSFTSHRDLFYLTLVGLRDRKPLAEIRRCLRVSKQLLNYYLSGLVKRGWLTRESTKRVGGVYEVTEKGLMELEERGKNLNPRSSRLREVRWVSAHHDLTFKFALRGQHFDRSQFCRRDDGKYYWYIRDGVKGGDGMTVRLGKTHVFFTVYGCNAASVRGVFVQGLARARWAAREFQRVTGARLSEEGVAVGLPHFVVTDKGLARWIKNGLDLSVTPKEVAGCKWWLDNSHKGLVEFSGARPAAEAVGEEVSWLLAGGARKLLKEIQGLREELRYSPSNKPRVDVA